MGIVIFAVVPTFDDLCNFRQVFLCGLDNSAAKGMVTTELLHSSLAKWNPRYANYLQEVLKEAQGLQVKLFLLRLLVVVST